MEVEEDHYSILEITKEATFAEIRKAFKKQALKWHPDMNPLNVEESTKRFQKIAVAYETLSDEDSRRRYDRGGFRSDFFDNFDFSKFWTNMYNTDRRWYDEVNAILLSRAEMWRREEELTLKQRRARYKVPYVTPEEITTWADEEVDKDLKDYYGMRDNYSGFWKFRGTEKRVGGVFPQSVLLNKKVAIYNGSVVHLELDAVMNACNTMMAGGGGVDGAIHCAAGAQLYQEESMVDGCPYGEVRVTRGYCMPARMVIHAAGPIGEKPKKLKNCYINALNEAVRHGCRTVGFCGVSTGNYGYPIESASEIALSTVRKWLETDDNLDKLDLIVFACYHYLEQKIYQKSMQRFFPKEDFCTLGLESEKIGELMTEEEEYESSEPEDNGGWQLISDNSTEDETESVDSYSDLDEDECTKGEEKTGHDFEEDGWVCDDVEEERDVIEEYLQKRRLEKLKRENEEIKERIEFLFSTLPGVPDEDPSL